MFTLKLYRRCPPIEGRSELMSKIIEVDHVTTIQIGKTCDVIQLHVFAPSIVIYDAYFIGKPEEGMDAYGRHDLHLDSGGNSWWDWAYLENSHGRTTERFAPNGHGPM